MQEDVMCTFHGYAESVSMSPDCQWLAFKDNPRMHVFDIRREITHRLDTWADSFSWSPSGRFLLTQGDDQVVYDSSNGFKRVKLSKKVWSAQWMMGDRLSVHQKGDIVIYKLKNDTFIESDRLRLFSSSDIWIDYYCFTEDCKFLLTIHGKRLKVQYFDLVTKKRVWSVKLLRKSEAAERVRDVAISKDVILIMVDYSGTPYLYVLQGNGVRLVEYEIFHFFPNPDFIRFGQWRDSRSIFIFNHENTALIRFDPNWEVQSSVVWMKRQYGRYVRQEGLLTVDTSFKKFASGDQSIRITVFPDANPTQTSPKP